MPNYELVQEEPPPKRGPKDPPIQQNLRAAAETPGVKYRIVSYPAPGTARQIASQLRTGKIATPPGRWTFVSGRVDSPHVIEFGVWATFHGPIEETTTDA